MPPVAILIIDAIQAAITEAPQAIALIQKGKEFISQMFETGLITREQQDALHSHVDATCAAILAGEVPLALQVEPDEPEEPAQPS